jgi:hypothetical protein
MGILDTERPRRKESGESVTIALNLASEGGSDRVGALPVMQGLGAPARLRVKNPKHQQSPPKVRILL